MVINTTNRSFCPVCKRESYRIRRRLIDRLLSLFRPVRRYRCASGNCGWEGNVPDMSIPRATNKYQE